MDRRYREYAVETFLIWVVLILALILFSLVIYVVDGAPSHKYILHLNLGMSDLLFISINKNTIEILGAFP